MSLCSSNNEDFQGKVPLSVASHTHTIHFKKSSVGILQVVHTSVIVGLADIARYFEKQEAVLLVTN